MLHSEEKANINVNETLDDDMDGHTAHSSTALITVHTRQHLLPEEDLSLVHDQSDAGADHRCP